MFKPPVITAWNNTKKQIARNNQWLTLQMIQLIHLLANDNNLLNLAFNNPKVIKRLDSINIKKLAAMNPATCECIINAIQSGVYNTDKATIQAIDTINVNFQNYVRNHKNLDKITSFY